MSVRVGVVGVPLRLKDAKPHADYARADDVQRDTLSGRPQQLLPVVTLVVCHVFVCDILLNALDAKLALPLAGGLATITCKTSMVLLCDLERASFRSIISATRI